MKAKLLTSFVLLSFLVLILSCASKKDDGANGTTDQKEWKEMDEFHMVMAETFHPYKDSANLEPAKSRASELATAAEKWSNASLPERVDNDEMKEKLQELKSETTAFVTTVTAGDDKAIGDQLTKVHDLFHAIQETWYGGGDHGEHH